MQRLLPSTVENVPPAHGTHATLLAAPSVDVPFGQSRQPACPTLPWLFPAAQSLQLVNTDLASLYVPAVHFSQVSASDVLTMYSPCKQASSVRIFNDPNCVPQKSSVPSPPTHAGSIEYLRDVCTLPDRPESIPAHRALRLRYPSSGCPPLRPATSV